MLQQCASDTQILSVAYIFKDKNNNLNDLSSDTYTKNHKL